MHQFSKRVKNNEIKYISVKFSWILILVFVVTAFPSKYIYYLAPLLIIFTIVLKTSLISPIKLLRIILLIILLSVISLFLNSISGITNSYSGLAFSLMTWSPIIILLSFKTSNLIVNNQNLSKQVYFLTFFTLIQAVVGIFQFIVGHNADGVAGTFGLFDFMGNITITQVYFTFNLFMLNTMLFVYWRKVFLVRITIIISFIAIALAQSGHQTIFYTLTIITMFFWNKLRTKTKIQMFSAIAILIFGTLMIYPDTVNIAQGWYGTLVSGKSPKSLIVFETINLLKNPKIFLFGTGLGQYTSRAAQFSSGELGSGQIPDFLINQSSWYLEIVRPLIILCQNVCRGSAIAKPYFSLVTLVAELGVPITLLIMLWVLNEVKINHFYSKLPIDEISSLAQYKNIFLIFLLLCSTIENYFEFVQAITIPIVLYILANARIKYLILNFQSTKAEKNIKNLEQNA